MKTSYILLFLVQLINGICTAQNKDAISFHFQAGVKYTPLEYLGGPALGLNMKLPNERINLSIRKDMIFSLASEENDTRYVISDYHTYNYLTIGYGIVDNLIMLGAGAAWIYNGTGENRLFNPGSGYYAITTFVRYAINPLDVELRGDIPIGTNQKVFDQGYLSPVSLAVTYSLHLKKQDR